MPPVLPSDEDVVRRTLADPDAFEVLVERYAPRLLRYLSRLGVSVPEDRDDILQNAFIKAYVNLNSFDPELAFSSWVYRITHNEAMSFFRHSHARPHVTLGDGESALMSELADETADASTLAELRLSSEELAKGFAALSPRERDVLTLRYFEEKSYSEMSDILKIPVGTVSTLIYRAKHALKAVLPENFEV